MNVEAKKEEKIRKEKEQEKILNESNAMTHKIIEKKSKKNSYTKQQFHHMNSLSLSKNKLNIELNKTFNPFKREKKQDSLHLSHLETDVKKKNEIKENNKII